MKVAGEPGENVALERDFHFSLPPTVTTGFIGFSFDIKK
jgi:hypothetical protein